MVKRVLVAVVFVPIVFVTLFLLPAGASGVLLAVICGGAAFELMRAYGNRDRFLSGTVVTFAAVIPLLTCLCRGVETPFGASYAMVLLLVMVLFGYAIHLHGTERELLFRELCVCLFAGGVMPSMLNALVELRVMKYGNYWVLLPVIIAFVTDGGAYFAGVLFGSHRGITNVSPNKSLEGYVGGVVSGIALCLVYGLIVNRATAVPVNYGAMAVYGVVGACVTELGDLAFSLIKRQLGVKDFGHLLPGHGGLMDRFDSMVFAAPAVWVMVCLFPAFS